MVSRNRAGLVFLNLALSFSFSIQSCGDSFAGITLYDKALLGYSFGSLNTTGSDSCTQLCLIHDQCMSYNYALSGSLKGLCELNTVKQYASRHLQHRTGFVFVDVVHKKREKSAKGCAELWKDGARISSRFRIQPNGGSPFDVHCDFTSETGWIWTLVMSQSHANRAKPEFLTTPLFHNAPVNENEPNWAAYRLSLNKMQALRLQSTHWRATCSLPLVGVDGTDYVRAKFADLDPLTLAGYGACKKVEYQNVRGHSCVGCTSAWWQHSASLFHHDSSYSKCGFQETPGYVPSEDNFGAYLSSNPKFRCSSDDSASTNHWFGERV